MIFESGPWKEDLLSYYDKIIEYCSSKYFQNDDDVSDKAYSILEKSIFIKHLKLENWWIARPN